MKKEIFMEKLYKLLDEVLTFDLIQATVSGPRKKGGILKLSLIHI